MNLSFYTLDREPASEPQPYDSALWTGREPPMECYAWTLWVEENAVDISSQTMIARPRFLLARVSHGTGVGMCGDVYGNLRNTANGGGVKR